MSIASQNGHLEVVRCLVEAGASQDKADTDVMSPLYSAGQNGYLPLVRCMVEVAANKGKAATNGALPVSHATHDGHLEVGKHLLGGGRCTPLSINASQQRCTRSPSCSGAAEFHWLARNRSIVHVKPIVSP